MAEEAGRPEDLKAGDLGLDVRIALLAELGIPAIATDLGGIICHWNQPAAELYGRAQNHMLGMPLTKIRLSQTDSAIAASIVSELLRAERWQGELEIEDATGTPVRLGVGATVVVDSDGQAVGFEAAFGDLSERTDAEQRAIESASQLRLTQRIGGLGSWEWDPRDDQLTSDRFTAALGLDPEAQLTMTAALVALPATDRARLQSALTEMRLAGVDSLRVAYRLDHRDGTACWLEAHCAASRDQDGTVTRIRGITQDVTARVRGADRLQEAGEFLQGTLDSLTDHVAVLDGQGKIVAVNAAWRRFAHTEGGNPDCVGGNYITVCEDAADPLAQAVVAGLTDLLAGKRHVYELEYPCHGPSVKRWFLLRATRYDGAGPLRVVMAHENITQRHDAQEKVFLQAELLDELDVSVIVTDLNLTVLSWNAGAERLYGWSAEEAVGRPASETILPPDANVPADEEESKLALQRDGRWDGEYLVRRKDGSMFPAHIRSRLISDQDGRVTGAASVAMDITERKESERALLSARNYLHAVTDSIGEGVFAVDSEGRGSYINQAAKDLLGWSSEELLGREVQPILHSLKLDGSPLPADECPIVGARRDGELVRVEDDIFIRRDGTRLPVAYTASPFATEEGIEGCVVVFEDITERKRGADRVERDLEKLAWLERIQEALTEDRFVLYAQPIVDLRTGEVVQRELLIRMRDEQNSDGTAELIGPGSFLPVAEEFGLITEIDRWVIDRSAEIVSAGQAVEINVSGRSISAPGLLDYIENAIERTGADPGRMVFEITETTLVSDELAARAFVAGLHALGCKVALDDFGTGYGGFTYLKQLPVDFLKIDIEFVRDLRTNSASRNVIGAIISLATGFGVKTVGEGVEDEKTLMLLRELGVDYAQGFHLGAPAPLEMAGHPQSSGGNRK